MGAILILAALASGGSPEQCRRIHYTADGRVIETSVKAGADGAAASSRSSGQGSSSSSVSVSSSSRNGASVASSSSSADGVSRSTTVRRDAKGCTIIVDDRPPQE